MHEQIKKRIESVITNLDQLPSIPDVASKILNMANDPNVSFKKISELISQDQAITANILKLCNSAYFSKGKEIDSIDRAIVTLGLKEVKDIIIVIVAKPVLNKACMGYDLSKGDLWKQSLLVSNISKRLALLIKRKDIADVVFTGGLIHNVGKVVLALYVQSAFKDILNYVETNNVTFNEAEKEIMGFNHQEVGERILEKWKFPQVLKSIVRYYQNPENSPEEFKTEVSVVHIAQVISLMAGIGVGSDGLYHQFNSAALNKLGLSGEIIEDTYSKVPEILKQVKELI